mmetsp:Transcript_17527/g.54349  ORF Transcript_17527/g.54349 Transcript_17527/m.54349 type:complete len:358 (+) Transcript_17527:740-1813(+)
MPHVPPACDPRADARPRRLLLRVRAAPRRSRGGLRERQLRHRDPSGLPAGHCADGHGSQCATSGNEPTAVRRGGERGAGAAAGDPGARGGGRAAEAVAARGGAGARRGGGRRDGRERAGDGAAERPGGVHGVELEPQRAAGGVDAQRARVGVRRPPGGGAGGGEGEDDRGRVLGGGGAADAGGVPRVGAVPVRAGDAGDGAGAVAGSRGGVGRGADACRGAQRAGQRQHPRDAAAELRAVRGGVRGRGGGREELHHRQRVCDGCRQGAAGRRGQHSRQRCGRGIALRDGGRGVGDADAPQGCAPRPQRPCLQALRLPCERRHRPRNCTARQQRRQRHRRRRHQGSHLPPDAGRSRRR